MTTNTTTASQPNAVQSVERNAVLEEAALACEAQLSEGECPERSQYCADAIRALKSAPRPVAAEQTVPVVRPDQCTEQQRNAVYMALHYYMKVAEPDEWKATDEAIAAFLAASPSPAAPSQEAQPAVQAFNDYPDFNETAMGCGLEDRGITDRYDAMRYGWEEAIERVSERIANFLAAPSQQPAASPTGEAK